MSTSGWIRRVEKAALRFVLWLFALTEERLPPCACPSCSNSRLKRRDP